MDNREQVLADLLGLEAWHDPFGIENQDVSLYVDVGFDTAKLGGTPGDEVMFRLGLKRAELHVILDPKEPASIVPSSISRDNPRIKVNTTTSAEKKSKRGFSMGLDLGANFKAIAPRFLISSSTSNEMTEKEVTSAEAELEQMLVTYLRKENPTWCMVPAVGLTLKGHPWYNPAQAPRLQIRDRRRDRSKSIAPSIRVEVRCLREDLHISDLAQRRENGSWGRPRGKFAAAKEATAEAVIRTKLFEAGLTPGDISDPFSPITLCGLFANGEDK